ncbi:hypothetical protein [Bacillus changyiensis]|uniref:hypothetical protein n=1 Tax=Bacillus changyiensis TaxID=3004103 RepID=UPI0022E294A2|nr:hypothetical protein [Bacillus changyiensis]MDA1478353.1 hypothetical protein [Bacillus changyiensis]
MSQKQPSYEELVEQHQLNLWQIQALNEEVGRAHYELSKYKALYTLEAKKNEDLTIKNAELESKLTQSKPQAAK